MIHDVSGSELDALRQCPHKHTLQWRQNWAPAKVSPALAKGTLFHSVMEAHYGELKVGNLINWIEEKGPQRFFHDEQNIQDDVQNLVEWMYEGYLKLYGLDSEWKIVAVEHEAECWLPGPSGRKSQFRFHMKIDLIIRWNGKLWIVDHKTGANLPTEKELALSDQFGLYTWGMRQLGKPIQGVIYNAIRTQRNKSPMAPEDRFSRTMLYRTDQELDRIALEAYRDFKAAYNVAEENAPRHPNPDTCRWRCPFTEPCLASRKMNQPEMKFEHRMLKDMGFIQDFSSDKGSRMLPFEGRES